MGLLNAILGHASEVKVEEVQGEIGGLLASTETVERAYKFVRDMMIFTNKRIILIDKQGVTGSKTEYQSIPYRSVTRFSLETAGSVDLDAELKIWVSGHQVPIQKTFNKGMNVLGLQALLAEYVLK